MPILDFLLAQKASGSGTASGNNGEVQYSKSGVFSSDPGFNYDDVNKTLVVGFIAGETFIADIMYATDQIGGNSVYVNQQLIIKDSIVGAGLAFRVGEILPTDRIITITCDNSDVDLNLKHAANPFTGSTVSTNGVKGLVPAPTSGSPDRVLKADGTWGTPGVSSIPGGSNTQVQFNDGGVFGGSSGFTYNKTTNALTITGAFNSGTLTESQLLATDASKNIQSLPVITYPSLTEISYIKGVTSSVQTQLNNKASLASPNFTGTVTGISIPFSFAISNETSAITVGTSKITFRVPYACTLTNARASLTTASSSGIPTFDIKKNGTSILSTKLTIDVNEKTSLTAAIPLVISNSSLADDDEISIDINTAGTGAVGAKITIYLTRV